MTERQTKRQTERQTLPRRNRRLPSACLLALALGLAHPVSSQDDSSEPSTPGDAVDATDDSARIVAARRYIAAVPTHRMLEDTFEGIARQVPEADRQAFLDDIRAIVDSDRIESITLHALVDTFTLDELNALADFYSSEHGASARATEHNARQALAGASS